MSETKFEIGELVTIRKGIIVGKVISFTNRNANICYKVQPITIICGNEDIEKIKIGGKE